VLCCSASGIGFTFMKRDASNKLFPLLSKNLAYSNPVCRVICGKPFISKKSKLRRI
jgi:hypothetical protein